LAASELLDIYLTNKEQFDEKLNVFRLVWQNGSDTDIFGELCYCLCTPREKAQNALEAVRRLGKEKLLTQGTSDEIKPVLKESGIALYPQKAENIIKNRALFFPDTKRKITEQFLCYDDIFRSRKELAYRVPGIGFKEASHFLRNIGFGSATCILDTHIINQLVQNGLLPEKPKSLTEKKYLEIEQAMIQFAAQEHIPVDVLDLVFMFKENPDITK
jgi:N-glycosylase/DNA lyase